MRERLPLPEPFSAGPFRYGDARAAGIGQGRLRGSDLERPFHGIRVRVSPSDDPFLAFLARCRAYRPLLSEGQHFSHLTAARLWDLPLAARPAPEETLHVTSRAPRRSPRARGITGHSTSGRSPIAHRYGLPVSSPTDTWLQLTSVLPLDDLVILGDALVLSPAVTVSGDSRPHTTPTVLASALAGYTGPGKRAGAQALELVRTGVESPRETLLRLLIVRAGLPEPLPGVKIFDTHGGFIARVDLCYREWRVVVEYDGEQHRTDPRQYERDLARIEALRRAGWEVVRVLHGGLFRVPVETVARVRSALRAGGWRG